jgi:hypothetical protein
MHRRRGAARRGRGHRRAAPEAVRQHRPRQRRAGRAQPHHGNPASLLDAVNHASTEQRSAIDALVASSAGLLERVGKPLRGAHRSRGHPPGRRPPQVAGGAVEVASLGEAFGFAVQRFGESNDSS